MTWASRTAKADWEVRAGHTSVVDAAGAIYVIGGGDIGNLNDVWASTNGGAQPDSPGGRVVLGGHSGVLGSTTGVLGGY